MGKRLPPAEEVNLVPIMNLVTILIPFLLMAATFVSLAVIDSALPHVVRGGDPVGNDGLTLSVLISDEGYRVTGAGEILDEGSLAVPCAASGCPSVESWDTAELSRVLGLIKDEAPLEDNIILVPESRIPYEVLVATMDATRLEAGTERELFAYVVIAGGVE